MMETRIPMGISEFFRMTRQPTSAQMRKIAPTRAQRGTSLLWSGSENHPHRMGHDQAHETDGSRRINGKTNYQGGQDHIEVSRPVKVRSQCDGGLISQKHQVQIPELGPENQRSDEHHRKKHAHPLPLAPARLPIVQNMISEVAFLLFTI